MKPSKARLSPQTWLPPLGLLLLVGLGGGWSLQQHTRATEADRAWRRRQVEWESLQSTVPAPLETVATALAERIATGERVLAKMRISLGESETALAESAAVPEQRAEAFFALAQFVETQRSHAETAGVGIPPGIQFGFSAYGNSGPPLELIGAVHRQQRIVEKLLTALWRARPSRLVRVQREPPSADATKGGNAPPRGTGRDDHLDWPEARRLDRDGIVDTEVFRLDFVGHTSVLRRFLEELPRLGIPLVVRQIEVEPAGEDGRAGGGLRSLAELFRDEDSGSGATANEESVVPVIAANDSRFSVTIAHLRFEDGSDADVVAAGEHTP